MEKQARDWLEQEKAEVHLREAEAIVEWAKKMIQ